MTPFTLILPDGEGWESYVMFTQNNCILYANIMFHANIKHINCLSGTNKKYKNLKRSGFLYLMKNPSRFIKRICLAFSSLAFFTEKKGRTELGIARKLDWCPWIENDVN